MVYNVRLTACMGAASQNPSVNNLKLFMPKMALAISGCEEHNRSNSLQMQ
jgi:hypothetical protein